MNRLITLLLLVVITTGHAEIPDVTMHDIDGVEYDLHQLLAEGHYVVFYMLSKT